MAHGHAERQISFNALKKYGLHADPPEHAMASVPHAGLSGNALPLALPMDEYIDLLSINDDAVNSKIECNFLKLFKIPFDLQLHPFKRINRQH